MIKINKSSSTYEIKGSFSLYEFVLGTNWLDCIHLTMPMTYKNDDL